jgi:hypothetical protein
LDGLEDLGRLEGLGDERLRAGLNRLDNQRLLAHRGAHDDLGVGIVRDDLLDRGDAVHLGHDHVHRHEVGLKLFVLLYRLDAILSLSNDFKAVLRKDPFDHHPHDDGIVDDEDSLAHPMLPRRSAKNTTRSFELNRPKDRGTL